MNCGCTCQINAFQNRKSWYSKEGWGDLSFVHKWGIAMIETEEKRIEDGSLETQLFSWDGWDGDQECMTFYDPILKVQIGKHPPGTKFDCATILWIKGKLQLINHGPVVDGHADSIYTAEYNLKLTVADTISE